MAGPPKGARRSKRFPASRPDAVAVRALPPPSRARRSPRENDQAPLTAIAPVAPAAGKRRQAREPGRQGAVRRIAGVVRRHPVASVVTVLAAGALVTLLVRTSGRWRPALAAIPRAIPPLRLPDIGPLIRQLTPQLQPIARRIGVAGMQVSTDLADGAHRKIGFRWKRRPADALERSWPTDEVEVGSRRADGGRTGFQLTWKTLPTDALPDSEPRYPGDSPLGETSVELDTRQPDGRKTGMSFTWRKLPPGRRPPDEGA